MKGTTIECLHHYGMKLITSVTSFRYIREARRPFCEAMKCTDNTAGRWFRGECSPVGEGLIRFRVFLENIGYSVIENENIDPRIARCNRAIAENRITVDKVKEVLGLANLQQILSLLQNRAGVAEARLVALAEFLNSAGVPNVDKCRVENCEIQEKPAAVKSVQKSRLKGRELQDTFYHQVLALLPLAEYFFSDDLSDEDRDNLRERFSKHELFMLSNILSGLCSRTARNDIMEAK